MKVSLEQQLLLRDAAVLGDLLELGHCVVVSFLVADRSLELFLVTHLVVRHGRECCGSEDECRIRSIHVHNDKAPPSTGVCSEASEMNDSGRSGKANAVL